MLPIKSGGASKKLQCVLRGTDSHWVGDGFPVRTLFTYSETGVATSPFLLFDYAGPWEFPPTDKHLGVGAHPHRGFETVTIVYSGEVEHRDSSGNAGRIGTGDVQWMTAASGLVHEEFHGSSFARTGGLFEMVQLWVNLPARYKMSPSRYQSIFTSQIPVVTLPRSQGSARVIAGQLGECKGPAKTFTPIHIWDLHLASSQQVHLPVPEGYTTMLAVLRGAVWIDGAEAVGPAEIALFDREGDYMCIDRAEDATALLLCGEPIEEPMVGSGPFVMNSKQEIRQAMVDYQSGKMGRMPWISFAAAGCQRIKKAGHGKVDFSSNYPYGLVHTDKEGAYLSMSEAEVFAVSDGRGGQVAGEIANY